MSQHHNLHDSYGPEVTPYQNSYPQPLESCNEASTSRSTQPDGRSESQERAQASIKASHTTKSQGRYCRLSRGVFWLAIALAATVALGLGLGVGLGVGLRHKPHHDPATSPPNATSQTSLPTSSPTSTTTQAPVTSGVQGLAANSCTFRDPKTYRGSGGAVFVEYCFTDWPRGVAAANGRDTVVDLKTTITYTFEACMENCIKYNGSIGEDKTRCLAITYNSNLTSAVGGQSGNCFLKSAKGIEVQASDVSASAALVL